MSEPQEVLPDFTLKRFVLFCPVQVFAVHCRPPKTSDILCPLVILVRMPLYLFHSVVNDALAASSVLEEGHLDLLLQLLSASVRLQLPIQ